MLISRGRGITGTPGLMTDPAKPGTCDQCQIGDLDLEAMQKKVIAERKACWEEAKHLSADEKHWRYGINSDTSEAEYCNRPPLQTFAILDETGWHEKGEMGWWGIVHDEKDDWPQIFQNYFAELLKKPKKYIAIVDCHI